MMITKLPRLTCKRCSHVWIPRADKLPKFCPRCRSQYWNRNRGGRGTSTPSRESEKSALYWVTRTTGFEENEVGFSRYETPDFVLSDGQSFEVKKVAVSGSIVIPKSQVGRLKEHDTKILVFEVSGRGDPIAIIPASDLNPENYESQRFGHYGSFRITFSNE